MRRRLIVLLCVGVLAIACAYLYARSKLPPPSGTGPAGPAVAASAFQEPWSTRRVLLLGIGDSITAGFGANSKDHSYFERVINNPRDEFPEMRGLCLSRVLPNLTSKNLAESGSTSFAHLNLIEEAIEVQSPEVFGLIMMTTGGNDLIHSYGQRPPRDGAMYGATMQQAESWIANFHKRLNKMMDLLDERFPGGCHVFLADIYDPTDGVGDAPSVFLPDWPDGLEILAKYNEVIHRCAEQRANVELVPLHQTFLGHGSHCGDFWRSNYCAEDPHYWFYYNIEDPNDRGYDAIRRIFLNSIADAAEKVRR